MFTTVLSRILSKIADVLWSEVGRFDMEVQFDLRTVDGEFVKN